jgi:hypothetical protein
MKIAIAKKDTSSRSKSKFLGVEGSKIWPTGAPKNAKGGIIRLNIMKELGWAFEICNTTRQ